MRVLHRVVLAVAVLLALSSPSSAGVFGTLNGVVHDPQHRPVPGATVTLGARNSEWARTTTTDGSGEFQFAAVPLGDYFVEVALQGFQTARETATVTSSTGSVLHVQLQIAGLTADVSVSANPEAAYPASATPTTLVSRGDIAATPGASRTNSLAMVTAFVPGSYMTHDQLHVRGGHQVSWLVDGVPVPNTNIASNVGPQFDPKDADYLEVHRGSYDAEYGDRTYGVFNVVPRTGFERNNDAEILVSAGSYLQTNDQFSLGGHSERLAYYASVTGNRSDLGLQTPSPEIIHDRQRGLGGFGSLVFNANANNQLRLVTSVRGDRYQVPNTPQAEAAGMADVERESDAFVNLSWVRTFGSGTLFTVAPFYHRNGANYDGGASDFPTSTTVHHTSVYAGAQATVGFTAGQHDLRAGFYGFFQRDDQSFGLTFNDASNAAFAVQETPQGSLSSLFVQDAFKATSWLTLTGGIRQTHFSGVIVENATSPRVGFSARVPSLGWTFRGFYGRFYQAPPLLTVSSPLLAFLTDQNLALMPLHGERDQEYQVGVMMPVRGWTLDADVFRTRATNYFDHASVGNSNVFFPLTIEGALIRGAELTLKSPRVWRVAQVHLAYANLRAQGMGGVTGGLTDFSPADETFLLDHDQRHTLSAGVNATFPRGFSAGATAYYGSGFPDDGGPSRLQGVKTVDLTLGKALGERLSVSLTALNLANQHILVDNSPTFGGTHFNNPRELFAEVRYRFHY